MHFVFIPKSRQTFQNIKMFELPVVAKKEKRPRKPDWLRVKCFGRELQASTRHRQ